MSIINENDYQLDYYGLYAENSNIRSAYYAISTKIISYTESKCRYNY